MKTFAIIGGFESPSAIVVAEDCVIAKKLYNDWLELSYGRRDEGVGCSELEPHDVCMFRGLLFCYSPGVRGHREERYDRTLETWGKTVAIGI